jgi:hypothetical protein
MNGRSWIDVVLAVGLYLVIAWSIFDYWQREKRRKGKGSFTDPDGRFVTRKEAREAILSATKEATTIGDVRTMLERERRKTAEQLTRELASFGNVRVEAAQALLAAEKAENLAKVWMPIVARCDAAREKHDELCEALAVLWAHKKGAPVVPGEATAFAVLEHWIEARAARQAEGPDGLLRRVLSEMRKGPKP